MRTIPLTKGRVAIVDDDDYERLSSFSWYARKQGDCWYAYSEYGTMHQMLLRTDGWIDHRDRDGLNNQKTNLRPCTGSQNAMNRKLPDNNSSGFKGVGYHIGRNKWVAYIKINGQQFHLGMFNDPQLAADIYDSFAVLLFGEFALTNRELKRRSLS